MEDFEAEVEDSSEIAAVVAVVGDTATRITTVGLTQEPPTSLFVSDAASKVTLFEIARNRREQYPIAGVVVVVAEEIKFNKQIMSSRDH